MFLHLKYWKMMMVKTNVSAPKVLINDDGQKQMFLHLKYWKMMMVKTNVSAPKVLKNDDGQNKCFCT